MQHSTREDMSLHPRQLAHLASDPLIGLWLDTERLEQFVDDAMAELGPYAARVVEQEARWRRLVHTAGAVVSIEAV